MTNNDTFARFSNRIASLAGRASTFAIACVAIVIWAVTGPFLGFSDVWQLTINTGTTIITFLMVFIIQNTQNRDSRAMQIKLDELIRATMHAHNALLDLEELSEPELEAFREQYASIARDARRHFGRDDNKLVVVKLPIPPGKYEPPGEAKESGRK
jgi:low affinity Fe/Cu permease